MTSLYPQRVTPHTTTQVLPPSDISVMPFGAFGLNFVDPLFNKQKSIQQKNITGDEIKCDVCGKLFLNQVTLRDHAIRHSGQTFPCTVCHKVFYHPGDLRQHLRVVHTQYTCNVCNHKFSSKHQLSIHTATCVKGTR